MPLNDYIQTLIIKRILFAFQSTDVLSDLRILKIFLNYIIIEAFSRLWFENASSTIEGGIDMIKNWNLGFQRQVFGEEENCVRK